MDNNGYQPPPYDAAYPPPQQNPPPQQYPPPQQHLPPQKYATASPEGPGAGGPGAGSLAGWLADQVPVGPGFQPTVITGQPQVVNWPPSQISKQEAPDHLVLAILVTFFCCLPLGIAAIYKSQECSAARARGDRASAIQNGQQAKKFSLIGLILGIVLILVNSLLVYYNLYNTGLI